MKKSILFLVLAAMVFAGCNLSGYKRTKTGLYYKIISKGGKKLKPGQYVKLQLTGYLRDSLIFDYHDAMPFYTMVDSVGRPHDLTELLHLMAEGDSAVAIQFVDSLRNKPGMQLPPFMHAGDKIKSCFKVIKTFDKVEDAQAAYNNDVAVYREKQEAKNKSSYDKSVKELEDYIAKNNIQATTKTAHGVYVVVKEQGTGAVADSGKIVGVKYRGTMLDGTFFDGNNTPDRKDTLSYPVAGGEMIPGFDEAVRGQKVGTKMTIYIPSQYGYGANGRDPIKPFSNLIFDINVVSVKDYPKQPQAPAGN